MGTAFLPLWTGAPAGHTDGVKTISTSPQFIGYFPKKIEIATEAMDLPGVAEIWSVSECISAGPEGWIQRWAHNDFGAFDTVEIARSVIPGAAQSYTVLGYRLWPEEFDDGGARPIAFPAHFTALRVQTGYQTVGYDAVSASSGQFECSPLSCNGGAREFSTNPKCLFATLEEALAAAPKFATESWEPGPYRVVEVMAPRRD